jgi:ribosomal protein L11 methyltransferase
MIVVATTPGATGAVVDRLAQLGVCGGHVVRPGGQRSVVLAPSADDAAAAHVAAALCAEGLAAVARPDGGARLGRWLEATRPIAFGGRLSVCVAWSEHDRVALSNLGELGPGGFGHGDHPTTRLLIEQLLARLAGGERVLDVGCGSGVLGLVALRLGAASLVAVDVKLAAVEATRRSAALNGFDVQATTAPLDEIDGRFDVIVANIGREAIVGLADQLVRLLAPGGWLAVSGFSPAQCATIGAALHPLAELDRQTSGDWAATTFVTA